MPNPFVFHRPLEPSGEDSPLDRTEERLLLLDLAEGGQAARLTAPRRYGKSTLLKAVAAEARERGFVAAYIDFSRLLSVEDAASRIARAYENGLEGAFRRTWRDWVRDSDVQVKAGPVALRRPASARRELDELHGLLDFPLRLHESHGIRSLVILDEFQDLLTADSNLDGLLRSHLQHHAHAASYVFAGSKGGMLAALFADRRRPLYEQARAMTVGPLPAAELGRWISERFEANGVVLERAAEQALLSLAAGHPQRAAMLAHYTFAAASGASAGMEAFERGRDEALADAEEGLTATWDRLDRTHRRALAVVAAGHHRLLAREALELANIAKSSMVGARDALVGQGDLLPDGNGGVRLADPFLGAWIRGPAG